MMPIRFIDLFCGIGGFRIGFQEAAKQLGIESTCVFSSDIDEKAKDSYEYNFSERPDGDITKIEASEIPDHDVLLAGFPCQPFSIIGKMKGLQDTRGTLFYDIARILAEKNPRAFILENVKQLIGHNKGRTLDVIISQLISLGYTVTYQVLNALNYGLPQKRERVVIVGWKDSFNYSFPEPLGSYKPLSEILEEKIDKKYVVSDYIKLKRKASHKSNHNPGIWHENKSGNVTSYPYSCALRYGASYNYLLVNGERRLTPREMLRLQGFPEWFKIVVSSGDLKRQAGNAVPVNIVTLVSLNLIPLLFDTKFSQPSVAKPTINGNSSPSNCRQDRTPISPQSVSQ